MAPSTPPFIRTRKALLFEPSRSPPKKTRNLSLIPRLDLKSPIRIFHSILTAAGCLATLLLASCIEGEEEVWINANGSGKARLEVSAPTLLFSKFGGIEQIMADAREGLGGADQIQLVELYATNKGSRTTLKALIIFEDARKLGQTLKSFRKSPESGEKSDEEILFGDTNIAIKLPNLSYTRTLDVRQLIPPEVNNGMTARLLGDAQISYRVHLPTAAKTQNADLVSQDGKTLTWLVPVTKLLAGPVEMNLTAPIPRFKSYLALAGLLVFSVLIALSCFWKLHLKKTPPSS